MCLDNTKKKIYSGMKRVLLYVLLLAGVSMQAQELLPWPTDTIDGKVYYRYTVEKSIGLYRISKNFGVSQEAILQANPELRERGLRFEEIILVPANVPVVAKMEPKQQEEPKAPEVPEVSDVPEEPAVIHESPEMPALTETAEIRETAEVVEDIAAVTETLEAPEAVERVDSLPEIHYADTVRLAYLLPLQAEMAQRTPMMDRFYDFYAGSLLAFKHRDATYADSLGHLHTTYYEVQTFDVGKDTRSLCQLLDSNVLAHTNAIIGPAYYNQVKAVSDYAQKHEIPVMVPFLPSVPDITTNNYLLKFNAYEDIQINALMEYLDTLRSSTNIVLVDAYASALEYTTGIRKLRDSIAARHFSVTHTSIRQILADSVGAALKDSVENILLFHSERYSNVQLLMPYLLSGKRGKRLTLLSQYAWQSERILLPQLFVSVFRTPDSEAMARYEQDFVQYFNHSLSSTQPRYDLLGYDLTMYLLEALRGGTFHVLPTIYDGLQSSLLFTQIENGGYENTHITIQRR